MSSIRSHYNLSYLTYILWNSTFLPTYLHSKKKKKPTFLKRLKNV